MKPRNPQRKSNKTICFLRRPLATSTKKSSEMVSPLNYITPLTIDLALQKHSAYEMFDTFMEIEQDMVKEYNAEIDFNN